MSRLISRDPFARTELHSSRDYSNLLGCGCAWCGQRPETPSSQPYLNRYWCEYNSGRRAEINGRFCSVSCMRSYHN